MPIGVYVRSESDKERVMRQCIKMYKENTKYSFDESYFENVDTPEKAYWLGFIAADGCIAKGKTGGSYRLRMCVEGKDVQHLEKFKRAINSDHKLYCYKKRNSYELSIFSKKVFLDLIKYNITPKKSLTLEYPSNLPRELDRHFIRGYFDGDGTVFLHKSKYGSELCVGFCSGSFKFLVSLLDILKIKGNISPRCKIRPMNGSYCFNIYSQDGLKWIFDFFYKSVLSDFYLDRKYSKFTNYFN